MEEPYFFYGLSKLNGFTFESIVSGRVMFLCCVVTRLNKLVRHVVSCYPFIKPVVLVLVFRHI